MRGEIAQSAARGFRRIAVSGALLACWCVLAPGAALGRSLLVSQQGPFYSPSQAIAAAQAGDTIEIGPGVYAGNLVLDRSLSLIGRGAPVIRGTGAGSVITVTAEGCAIRGLVVEHSGTQLATEDSGILLKSNRNRVEDNELRDMQVLDLRLLDLLGQEQA